jgi:RimJ/RimL family protein N-acetyltransferase
MLANDILRGQLVRLATAEPEELSKRLSRWHRNSEYGRLQGAEAAFPYSVKNAQNWLEKLGPFDMFIIYPLDSDQPIGDIGLDGESFVHGDTHLGVGIGEASLWSKGYGTDAMRVMLRYAFQELDLHRVSLTVFEYNSRAVHVYTRLGFQEEGRSRRLLLRDGRRWDVIHMGLLRSEWEMSRT